MDTKRCKRCGETKPTEDFYLLRRGKPWRASTCIPCNKIIGAEWQKAHREARNASVRKWADAHPFHARLIQMEAQARYQWRRAGLPVERISYEDVLARDGWVCQICKGPVTECSLSFDHTIPKVDGGPHTFENVGVAHVRCNDSKGGKRAAEARWMNRGSDRLACHRKDCTLH